MLATLHEALNEDSKELLLSLVEYDTAAANAVADSICFKAIAEGGVAFELLPTYAVDPAGAIGQCILAAGPDPAGPGIVWRCEFVYCEFIGEVIFNRGASLH